MKKDITKRKLLVSALSLLLCIGMLVGNTFAWFTDNVTSTNNIIKSGTLDVEMYWADGTEAIPDDESSKWNDASKGAIFNYDLWEPGYTEVRHIQIANKGSLALKYKVNVIANGEVSDLADVIDVYYVDPATQVSSRNDLTTDKKLGTLTEVLENLADTGNGTLKAGEKDTITIAFKMQENAGNEYQGKTMGTDFSIRLLATQFTYEEDSFDDQYDKDATYPDIADIWDGTKDTSWYESTETEYAISTAEEFAGLVELANTGNTFAGKTITLESSLDFDGNTWTPIKKFSGTLDGNDHTISNFEIDATKGHAGFFAELNSADQVTPAVVENLTLSDITATVGGYRYGTLTRIATKTSINNVTIKNVNVETTASTGFVGGVIAHGTINSEVTMNNITVEDFTVNAEDGAMMIGGIAAFVQRNGSEADGTNVFDNLHVKNFTVVANDTDGYCAIGGIFGQTQSVWQNPKFTNCSVTGINVVATGTVEFGGFMCYPGSVTFAQNCTTEGNIDVTGVTSANHYAGGFFGDYGWGDNIGKGDHNVSDCTANVNITTKLATAGGFVGAGINTEGKNKTITLTNCQALGTVTVAENGSATIGGFVGKTDRGTYVNCSATQTPFIGKVLDGYTLVDDGNGTLTDTK